MRTLTATRIHPDQWSSEEADRFAAELADVRQPTDYGFADDGEAMTLVCLDDSLKQRMDAADKLMRHAPVLVHPIPALVFPSQDYVNEVVVAHYERGGAPVPVPGAQAWGNKVIGLTVLDGRAFVFNGTHRLAALMRQGATHFTGRIVVG